MIDTVINLYRTKEEALYFKNSQRNSFYDFSGVHLLPNNQTAYVQLTNTPNGIRLEDWTVYMTNICTGERQDVSNYFLVAKLTNSQNGNPQFYWSLTNVPFDFGQELVYLEVSQNVGENFYSTPFVFTREQEDKVSTFHYKDKKKDEYQCIGFKTWFREEDYKEERSTYYELSTKNTVTHSVKQHALEVYQTERFAKSQMISLAKVLGASYLYVDKVRAYLYEAFEIPRAKAQENYVTIESYQLSFNKNDIFKPTQVSSGATKVADFDSADFNSSDFNA